MLDQVVAETHFEFPLFVEMLDKLSKFGKSESLVTEGGFFVFPDHETDEEYNFIYREVDRLAGELVDTSVEEIRTHTIETLADYGYKVNLEDKTINTRNGLFSYF